MDKCDLGEADWEVVGKSPARRLLIQFSGDANASARKVRAFYSKLNGPDGEWVNTEVHSIHGQSTRLFLGLGRSGTTARREFQTKKLARLCKAQDATKWRRSDRQQGIIYCNDMPVLSILVGSAQDEPTRLRLNCNGCLQHGINREEIRVQFEQFFQTSKKVVAFMLQVLNSMAALALQEAHSSEAELSHDIHLARREAACFASIPNRGAGGVAPLLPGISPADAADPDQFRHSEPIPGRAQRLQIKSDVSKAAAGTLPSMIAIYNARNFQLTAGQVQHARGAIRAELSTAEQQPERIAALVMGDFNFMDEAPLELTAPLVGPELPSHYAEQSQQCTGIDKIYISSPLWPLIQWCAEGSERQPIPQCIFESPLFTKCFDLLREAANVDNYPPFIRLKECKRLIREAARLTHNDMTDARAPCSAAALMTCRAISRAAWRNDWKSARTLHARTKLGAKFLDISDSNNIALIEPGTFRRTFEMHQQECLDQRSEALQQEEQARETHPRQRQRLRKMQRAIQRRGKLWAPTGKVLKLKAIEVLHDHSTAEKPEDMISELRRQWPPVFQAKPSRDKHVRRYLDKHIIPYDCSQMDIPTLGKMRNLIRRLNNSVAIETMKGLPVPLDSNDSLMIFTPKGPEPDDRISATRLAKATRPLSLKNTGCKIVAAMVNEMMKPIVAEGAHGAQKGFLPKRRFIEHVVAMGAQSRIAAMHDDLTNKDPLMVLYDFGDAFPSTCRTWLNIALEKADFPEGVRNMIEAVYLLPVAFANLAGAIEYFCALTSGILQGCPWSGTLCAAGVGPLIRDLHSRAARFKGA
ncbi:unnamed protein product, partial [Prorocentrum cordatum]